MCKTRYNAFMNIHKGGSSMFRLYQRNRLNFALVWIWIYVAVFSLADALSGALGIEKSITAPLSLVLSAILWCWLRRYGLKENHGLRLFRGSAGQYLYFLPLVVICSSNLWFGVRLAFTPVETVLYLLSMLCVGFLEEIIFRGFLYHALRERGVRFAILISGVTFGFGHIVNLLNGAEFLPTLLQVCYATAIGVLFTVIYHRSGSLRPCIIAHCAVNMLSAFAVERSRGADIVVAVLMVVISLVYAFWIWKRTE